MILMIDNERRVPRRFGGCFATARAQALAAVAAACQESLR